MLQQQYVLYIGKESIQMMGINGASAFEAMNSDLGKRTKDGWKAEETVFISEPLNANANSKIVVKYVKVDYNTYLTEKLNEIKTKAYTDALNLVKESVGPLQEMALSNLKERIDSLVNAKLEELKQVIK